MPRTPKQQAYGDHRKVIALHRSVAAASLGCRDFTDGTRRPVHADPDGRQWIIGDDGERVYGVWLPEEDAADKPVVVVYREG
jgi:hypothetical protein